MSRLAPWRLPDSSTLVPRPRRALTPGTKPLSEKSYRPSGAKTSIELAVHQADLRHAPPSTHFNILTLEGAMQFNPVIVDLSHHDNVRDWDAVKAFGILGVINKATEGRGLTDNTYAIRRNPARERGLLYGAYHFMRPGDPIAQADHFLEVALNVPHADELLLALDHEDSNVPLDNAKKWMQRVADKSQRLP